VKGPGAGPGPFPFWPPSFIAGAGAALKRYLDRPAVLRALNISMAMLLIVLCYPLFR